MADFDPFADLPSNQPAAGGDDPFADLPAAAPKTESDLRTERLRKIALNSLKTQGFGNTPGASDIFSDAYTFGLMKPVGAAADVLGGELMGLFGAGPEPNATAGERWRASTGGYQDFLDEARQNAGWAAPVADVAGAVTGGAGSAVRGAGVQAQRLLPWLAETTGLGAVEGAARNSEDWQSAAKGAALGGATSAAVGGLLRGSGELVTALRPSRADRLARRGTDPAVLRQQARDIYSQLDNAGIAYSSTQADDLANTLRSDLVANGWDPHPTSVHAPLTGVIQRVEGLRGQPVSLETLQQIREQVGSAAASNEPQVRRIAGRILGVIDGFVTNVDPPMSSVPGSSIAPMWQEARRLWRSANTAEDIGWRLDKAQRRSDSTGSGTNVDNPIRQNIRSVLDKAEQPRRFNPYTDAERAQMERVVSGSRTQNLLRSYGNRFGGSGPLGTMSDFGAGGAGFLGALSKGAEPSTALLTGAAAGGTLYGTGKLARMAADRMSQNEADALVRLISTGSLDAPQLVQRAGPPTRSTLARLLTGSALSRGAGLAAVQ